MGFLQRVKGEENSQAVRMPPLDTSTQYVFWLPSCDRTCKQFSFVWRYCFREGRYLCLDLPGRYRVAQRNVTPADLLILLYMV